MFMKSRNPFGHWRLHSSHITHLVIHSDGLQYDLSLHGYICILYLIPKEYKSMEANCPTKKGCITCCQVSSGRCCFKLRTAYNLWNKFENVVGPANSVSTLPNHRVC